MDTSDECSPPRVGLSRRALTGRLALAGLGLAGGCGGLAPPAAQARDAGFALGSNYAQNWAAHRSSPAARVVQVANGVRLETGAVGRNSEGVALWSRRMLGSSWTARFRFKRLDAVSSGPLTFALFYFGVTGDGTPGHPADMSQWPANTVPYTHNYAPHIRGARVAFARSEGGNPAAAGQATGAYFTASGQGTPLPAAPGNLAFPTGVACAVTITRRGSRITFASRPDGGAAASQTISSNAFAQWAPSGHFGLLCAPGRECEITGLSIG